MNQQVSVAQIMVWLVIVLLLGSPCVSAPPRLTARLSPRDQIQISVFRYQINTFGVTDLYANKRFYLGLGTRRSEDPAPGIVTLRRSSAYSVAGISRCTESTAGVFDRKSKAKGLAFLISDTEFTSTSGAQVHATLFRDGKGGFDALYTVVRQPNGRWLVTKCVIQDLH